jgi:crotonobetainyl-CoA:carnitine CoA-transferase CaiB-like acyl-CoA transferase
VRSPGDEPGGPLAGVRVVDLTSTLSGPYGAMLLADMGADVIKVEPPAGDPARDVGPRVSPDMGALFVNVNRGKRSVVLDLATDAGRADLKRLCDHADVLLHNLRPDSAARRGADPETLRAGHPELIHCAIRGFGRQGPYRNLPAYDDVVQAMSGIAAAQGWMSDRPQYVAIGLVDKVSGMFAALAICAALHRRAQTGEGSTIEVPMYETATAFGIVEHMWGRTFVPPLGEARYTRMASPVRRPFPTADGWIAVLVYTNEQWRRFLTLIGREDLIADERYVSLGARTEHMEECYGLVERTLQTDTTTVWLERLEAAGVPCGPYHEVDDLFADPHLDEVGFFEHVEHASEGDLIQFATPIAFDGVQPHVSKLAPRLGADTEAVLGEL